MANKIPSMEGVPQVMQQLLPEAHMFPADFASGAGGLPSPSLPQGLQHYKASPTGDTVGQPQVHLAAQQQARSLSAARSCVLVFLSLQSVTAAVTS